LFSHANIMTVLDDTSAAAATMASSSSTAETTSRDEENNIPVNNDPEEASNSQQQQSALQEQDDDDDDDDDLTIIGLDPEEDTDHHRAAALAWMEQNGPELEERRRHVLLRELQRVQRASFVHFILLCLIPTALLCIVVATVLGDDEPCGTDVTICRQEARTFINAFTTRCICDAIRVTGVN